MCWECWYVSCARRWETGGATTAVVGVVSLGVLNNTSLQYGYVTFAVLLTVRGLVAQPSKSWESAGAFVWTQRRVDVPTAHLVAAYLPSCVGWFILRSSASISSFVPLVRVDIAGSVDLLDDRPQDKLRRMSATTKYFHGSDSEEGQKLIPSLTGHQGNKERTSRPTHIVPTPSHGDGFCYTS
ncbi:hypothetical protein EI94DRAFT_1724808 [Lactarius quietus]|nr:hypothetical protein EI94DRAFT_1724808 [Lactarius quietus]